MAEIDTDGGMTARCEAVAAAEERHARAERMRRKEERRALRRSCLAWIVVLFIVVAAGVYFTCRHYGVDRAEIAQYVREAISERRYERAVEPFRTLPVADWSEAPEFLRPGKVETNTVYHAMAPGADGAVLLELTAAPGVSGFRVRSLSPIAEPTEMTMEDFKALVAKTPYLISVNGAVYFCSGKKEAGGKMKSAARKEAFRRSLFAPRKPEGK